MDPEELQQQAAQTSTGGDAGETAPKPKRKHKEPKYEHPPDPKGLDLATEMSALAFDGAADAAGALADVAKYAGLVKNGSDKYEESGADRDKLVEAIRLVRAPLGEMKKAHPKDDQLGDIAKRVYRYIEAVAPYYSQSRNVDILEEFHVKPEHMPKKGEPGYDRFVGKVDTRTCNITCLAMCLETLGIGPEKYEPKERVERVAAYFMDEQTNAAQIGSDAGEKKGLAGADLPVKGKGIAGLRLPDFLELACIAENCTDKSTFEEINKARWDVWGQITDFGSFLTKVAAKFGVRMQTERLKDQSGEAITSALRKFGKKHRGSTEKMVEQRNNHSAKYDASAQAAVDADAGPIDVEHYKQAVQEQVGPSVDAGKAIVVHLSGHYVKLQSIDDEGVIVDDPGSKTKSNRKVLWGEARAMGYFQHWYLFDQAT